MMCDEQFKQPAAVLVNILTIPPTGSGVKWLGQRSLIRTYVHIMWSAMVANAHSYLYTLRGGLSDGG